MVSPDSWRGTVVSIHLAKSAGEATFPVSSVRAVPGRGLEGDRYFVHTGTYSETPGTGREVTLIEFEAIEAMKRDSGTEIEPGQSRRNIVTRGVPLNHLVGREFRVGEVALRGLRLCEPCSYLEGITKKGVLAGLVHRGGLRAEILKEGTIQVGDSIVPENSS